MMNLSNLSFIDRKGNVIFIGPPGVGKTHLEIARGLLACSEGYRVLFGSARQLIRQLRTTQADDSLDSLLHHADIVAINGESYRIRRKEVKEMSRTDN